MPHWNPYIEIPRFHRENKRYNFQGGGCYDYRLIPVNRSGIVNSLMTRTKDFHSHRMGLLRLINGSCCF